jgi:hypothetical protein
MDSVTVGYDTRLRGSIWVSIGIVIYVTVFVL